jgi:hypothetical protein
MERTPPLSPSNGTRMIDSLGTVLVAVMLLAGSGVAWMGSRHLLKMRELLAEMGDDALPLAFKFLTEVQSYHGLDVCILVFFVAGLLALVLIRDRLRANFYGGLVAVLLVATGGVFYFTAMTPLVQLMNWLNEG